MKLRLWPPRSAEGRSKSLPRSSLIQTPLAKIPDFRRPGDRSFFYFFFVTQIRSFLSLSFVVSVCMGELMIWKGSNDPSQRWRNFFFFAANATRLRLANGFRSARSIFFWFVQPLRRRNLLRVESSEVLHGGPP